MSATPGSEAPTPVPTPQGAAGGPGAAGTPGGEPVDRARAALERMGAPAALAGPLVAALGPDAGAEVSADPWRLLSVSGVTPKQADFCARRALGEEASPDDPRRGRALAAHLLRRAAREGHTALEEQHLAGALRSAGVRSVEPAVNAALDAGDVMLFEMFDEPDDDFDEGDPGEMPDPDRWYALTRLGLAEQDLGEGLVRLAGTSEPIMDSATAAETVEATAERLGAPVDPRTAAALVTVALRGVCVLEHGAGARAAVAHTIACAAAIAADSEVGIAVAAPTAQAAAELNAALAGLGAGDSASAVPLATLLETRARGVHGRGSERPIEAGLVVVAGAMWLDVERAAALVDACADGTHLVLLADRAQAPSAAPGNVAADLASSRTVHVAGLPEDPDSGPIARTAAGVADGELEEASSPGREVVVVPADSASAAAHRAVQLITDSIPRALEIPPERVQIVTATRGGEAGADALNTACKERFNPGPGAYGGLDAGDRVLVTADGPGYTAGDVGYLHVGEDGGESAGDGRPALAVELPGGVLCPVADPAHLRPGWAVTVAAAHGSRWPAVVAVFPPETRASRPQVYTAVTAAQRHLSIVQAAGPALAEAVREKAALPRHTRLAQVLREG
ncbi:helix-hairpin-helix domain-containing protein [Streptomonospora halophila]|uniref:Helix-hairpin-helix domain-containing protein n=1 Tax=Streptomonospora halophila TaxID=427369 RepID=A0ABP9G7T9_9ACTN